MSDSQKIVDAPADMQGIPLEKEPYVKRKATPKEIETPSEMLGIIQARMRAREGNGKSSEDQEKEKWEAKRKTGWLAMVGRLYCEAFCWDKCSPTLDMGLGRRIIDFGVNGRGLWVSGRSRQGKSRLVFHNLKAHYMRGVSIKVIGGIVFAAAAGKAFKDPGETIQWLESMVAPKVLYIDDFGKRLTDVTAEAMHEVLEQRMKNEKPTWVTTNLTWDIINKILYNIPHLAESLIARAKEACEVVIV